MEHRGASPTSDDVQSRFEALQAKLVPLWRSIERLNRDEQTIVVVPSISIDVPLSSALLQAYEERFLFLLLLLRQPRARLVYVTSREIRPEIVEYYLHLLPGVVADHARRRLFLVTPLDGSVRPLAAKLLERPGLVRRIRALVPDKDRAHLVPFMNTNLERDLALALGIPTYGADPRHFHFGTKSGCRRLFAEEGVRHPLGCEGIRSAEELASAIARIRAARPGVSEVIVKHDEGVAGMGNAVVDLAGLPRPGAPDEPNAIAERLRAMRIDAAQASFEHYMAILGAGGGVVEERLGGRECRSPSAQLRITPLGRVECLSTHDQLLGGADGQTFLGARFPAHGAYAAAIMGEAQKVGRRLAREGVIGRFAVDFLVVRDVGGAWQTHAIEINLRKGGTTHPFLTLQFLTDGEYDAGAGKFTTPFGQEKFFVASDHVESPRYRVFTPADVFDVATYEGLHFDQARQTGVVFHMLSALGEVGVLGLTAVADSHDDAEALYRRTLAVLDAAAEEQLRPL